MDERGGLWGTTAMETCKVGVSVCYCWLQRRLLCTSSPEGTGVHLKGFICEKENRAWEQSWINGEFFCLLSDPTPSAMKYKHRSNETKRRGPFGEN